MRNIASNWRGFRRLWIIVALLLLLLLILLWIFGYSRWYSPWGNNKCEVAPTVVEKVIEKEKLVDNPDLLSRIASLQKENTSFKELQANFDTLKKENAQIATLKADVAELTETKGMVAGLKAKISALEAVDMNFVTKEVESPALLSRINLLESENKTIEGLKNRIAELEKQNLLVPDLQAKVKALEAADVNLVKAEDNTELLAKIATLEKENGMIAGLKEKLGALEVENGLIPNLKEKVSSLEVENGLIPSLKEKVSALEVENGSIPDLQAKVKALEVKLDNKDSENAALAMAVPKTAKLYFAAGSSQFPINTAQSMADVIVYLRTYNPNAKVSLAGYHDASGDSNWNRRLALKRSNRVRQILLDAGISSSRIVVEKPNQTLGTGTAEEARRVEIKVIN